MKNDTSSKDAPRISVVIPSFNKGKYIKETLQSIVDQKYKNIEVIVQDGGSTDGSLNIIKSYAEKYEYIKWESKKDRGQLHAIRSGLKKSTGDILTFINADDVYEENAFKSVCDAFKGNPKALWFSGRGRVISTNGKEIAHLVTKYKNFLLRINSFKFLLIVNYFIQPSVFITKQAYEEFGPFVGERGVVYEYATWLKLGEREMPKIINKNLSSFRLYSSSFSSTKADTILSDDYEIAKKYTNNLFILALHKLNNFGRILLSKIY